MPTARWIVRCVGCAIALSAVSAADGGVYEWREIDGTFNNTLTGRTTWGSTDIRLRRESGTSYMGDGYTPVQNRPNPRTISNAVFDQSGSIQNARGLTDFVWQWGQFLDHDIDLTPATSGEAFDIQVPNGDPVFPNGTTFHFNRSKFDPGTGTGPSNPRQQMNEITAWIDGSNVYGSDSARAAWLRDPNPANKGMLRVSSHATGDLLPYNDGTQANDGGLGTDLFVAGDIRANEQSGLTAMHTLMVREHNRWAQEFAAAQPQLSSDEVYERARRVVGAQMQTITYNEFLPALLGDKHMNDYQGYDSVQDPSIRNEFSTALYRIGHTMISPELKRLDSNGNPIAEGNLSLRDAFFRPDRIANEGGIDPILRGLASQVQQETDAKVIDDLRNFLFGAPGAGGMDLASLNIQRGRDHGLGSYNDVRMAYGLTPASSFDDITTNPIVAAALRQAYGQTAGLDNVGMLDPWVGALAEDLLDGSSVGELMLAGLQHQFELLRACDRFYYEGDAELASILGEIGMSMNDLESRLLSDIIMDNTGIEGLQANVFFIPAPGSVVLAMGGLGFAGMRRRR